MCSWELQPECSWRHLEGEEGLHVLVEEAQREDGQGGVEQVVGGDESLVQGRLEVVVNDTAVRGREGGDNN